MVKMNFPNALKFLDPGTAAHLLPSMKTKVILPLSLKFLDTRIAHLLPVLDTNVCLPHQMGILATRITHPRITLGIGVHYPQPHHQLLILPCNIGAVEVIYLVAGIASELGMTTTIIGSNARTKEDGVGVGNVASLPFVNNQCTYHIISTP